MANTVSSLKRVRVTERRTQINRMRRTRLKNAIRNVRRALDKKDAGAAEQLLPATFSIVDRAAKWGIIKKNTAARYKSRMAHRIRKVAGAVAA